MRACCHEIFLILNLCATVRHKNLKPKGLPTPLPPFSQPDPKISGFFKTSFNMLSLWKTLNEETFRMSLEPLQCPICLDPLRGLPSWKEVLSTPCGHLFCNTCLVTALRYGLAIEAIKRHQAFSGNRSARQCPKCRRRTRAEEAIKIFL